MIKICDSIMGSGKTTAAINYINAHPDKRYIYITPYLSEAERVKTACPSARFVEPTGRYTQSGWVGKVKHTQRLIEEGANIATTHTCFGLYTREMLEAIKEKGYTLLLDEVLSVFEKAPFVKTDIEHLEKLGLIEQHNGMYSLTEDGYRYNGTLMAEILSYAACREIFSFSDNDDMLYYWSLPIMYITAFTEVIVMTYMFSGQAMSMYLEMNGVDYVYIGVCKDASGNHQFTREMRETPFEAESEMRLRDLISVVDDSKLNENFLSDGKRGRKTAGSMAWYDRNSESVEQLRKNMQNYYKNRLDNEGRRKFMWGTYCGDRDKLRGDGYSRKFVPFNSRATNEFRDRTHLVYAANPFMNVGEKQFLLDNGYEPNEDAYALSILLQWIWRSAIRDGKPVELYLPIPRMRELLNDWLDSVEQREKSDVGGDPT